MKNQNNRSLAGKFKAALLLILGTGALAWSQSTPDAGRMPEVMAAIERLEILMATTEEEIRYNAPMEIYDDLRAARERLDLLAQKTEEMIRYIATNEDLAEKGRYYPYEDLPPADLAVVPNVFLKEVIKNQE